MSEALKQRLDRAMRLLQEREICLPGDTWCFYDEVLSPFNGFNNVDWVSIRGGRILAAVITDFKTCDKRIEHLLRARARFPAELCRIVAEYCNYYTHFVPRAGDGVLVAQPPRTIPILFGCSHSAFFVDQDTPVRLGGWMICTTRSYSDGRAVLNKSAESIVSILDSVCLYDCEP